MKGQTIDGRLAIIGYRPDGVVAVDIGDSQVVLCNLMDNVKSKSFDRLVLDKYGPFKEFDDVKPSDDMRRNVTAMINASSPRVMQVRPEDVGNAHIDLSAVDTTFTRRDFAQMLDSARLNVEDEMPSVISLQSDPGFLQHCLSTIVPAMQSSGLNVGDPGAFCSLLHLQRTGMMPTHMDMPMPMPDVAQEVPPTPQGRDANLDATTEITIKTGRLSDPAPARKEPENVAIMGQPPVAASAPVAQAMPQQQPVVPPQPKMSFAPAVVAAAPQPQQQAQASGAIGKPFKKAGATTAIGKRK